MQPGDPAPAKLDGVFRLLLKLATFAGAIAQFAVSILAGHGPGGLAHMGRLVLQLLILALIVGAWMLCWRYDALLRRLCPADTRLGGGRRSRRRGLMEPVILDEEGRDRRGPATLRADEGGRDGQPCRRARMAPLQGLANMNCRGPRSGTDQIGTPPGAKRPRRRPPEGLSP